MPDIVLRAATIADMADRVLYFGDGRIVNVTRNTERRAPGELTW